MLSHLIHRGWPPQHPTAVDGEGCVLRLEDGTELIDAASGALAVTVGYRVPEIAAAIADVAARLPFVHSAFFTNRSAEEYGDALTSLLPGTGDQHLGNVLMVNSGTDALELGVEAAYRVQVARGQPQRRIVLSRFLSYHGTSLGMLALGARVAMRQLVEPLLADFPHLPPPYPYRPEWLATFPGPVRGVAGLQSQLQRDLTAEELTRGQADAAAALEVAIEALGAENVCAFVAEPIMGASGGAIVPPPEYWPRVRDLCDRHGVLWVADEVMTGMGRTGRWMACEEWNVVPDIVTLGKGMGAGTVPLAGVVIQERHWRALASAPPGLPFGHTFSQHPLASAAGLAVLRYLQERDLLARAPTVETMLRERLTAAIGEHPRFGQLRGRGAMLGIEIVADRASRAPYAREVDATGAMLRATRQAGVLLYPARGGQDGVLGDAFLVAPPLVVSESECDRIAEAVAAGFAALPEP